jgi:acylphosphatase
VGEPTVRRRITVWGRVQQVGFRFFTVHHGAQLGLRGTVANRPDGGVEVVVEGSPRSVDELVTRVRTGPAMARVERIDVSEDSASTPLPPMRVTA